MNCCVNTPEDDSQHYDHEILHGPKSIVSVTKTNEISICVETVFCCVDEEIDTFESPPRQKVYIDFHKLIFYA